MHRMFPYHRFGAFIIFLLTGLLFAQPGMDLEELEQFWLDNYDQAGNKPALTTPILDWQLLEKAGPDECYDTLGVGGGTPPCATGVPKVNESYIWAMGKHGDNIWFGTGANVNCFVLGAYLQAPFPHETAAWVCEFDSSQTSPPMPGVLGDWRPPKLYVYNTQTRQLTDKSNSVSPLFLNSTLGIRAVGVIGDVVFLAGPRLTGGISMFAFDANSGNLIGQAVSTIGDNIRKFIVANGHLYTAVDANLATPGTAEGSVWRWAGTPAAPFTPAFDPINNIYTGFQIVGDLPDGQGAELAYHQNRLFVGTWPEPVGVNQAGIYMSPDFSAQGYMDNTHRAGWTKVWQVDEYEPDPVVALTYGVGAMKSFDGYLYWGTMHVPLTSLMAYELAYGIPATPDTSGMSDAQKDSTMADALLRTIVGTMRATSLLRGTDFHLASPQKELLYGLSVFTVFNPVSGWTTQPNNMNVSPMYGLAGYWNFFNNYSWSMAEYDGQLYIGTMDWSYVLKEYVLFFVRLVFGLEMPRELRLPKHFYGADLVRIPNSASPGFYENINGIGNYTNYGVRNMASNDALYLGMANPMNLLTDLTDEKPEGGWELIAMYADQPDTDGDGLLDIVEGTGDRDNDGIPNDQDYDPTGFLYDEATGQILPTGRIDVVPLAGNGSVTMIENGSSGYYQFLIDGLDYYQILVTPPRGWMLSTTCLPSLPPLDPTGQPDPVVLGNGRDGTSDTLTSNACTPYYLTLNLGNGDPDVINNNIPLQPNPIAVKLAALTANQNKNGVMIQWKTETETNTAGFNIYKSPEPESGRVRLNEELLPAKGNSVTGASYSFLDTGPAAGVYYYHLEDIDLTGGSTIHGPVSVAVNKNPVEYSLEQNYPNPLNPATTIQYTLPQSGFVSIVVYDAGGRQVRQLVNGLKEAGTHFVEWDRRDDSGTRVSSGVYFYRMSAGTFEKTCKMIVLN